MNKKFKNSIGSASVIVVILIALAVVLGGIYFYKKGTPIKNYTNLSASPSPTSVTQTQPQTASSDDSDTNINQELENAGTNLNTLDNTSANIDSSMSQTQVDPTQ